MKRMLYVLDAYLKNPVLITVIKEYPNGGVYGDDARGIRRYAPDKSRIAPILMPENPRNENNAETASG